MTKYNVGDKVIVRSDLSDAHGASSEMIAKWAGEVVTIKTVEPDNLLFGKIPNAYHIEEDDSVGKGFGFIWHDVMFSGYADPEKQKENSNPMPKLTNGMFGKEKDGSVFVVVNDKVVYQSGRFNFVKDIEYAYADDIVGLYESDCFDRVTDGNATAIWERDADEVEADEEQEEIDPCDLLIKLLELAEKVEKVRECK